MGRIQVTDLPGVGVMRTFLTAADDWIGVLELPSGRRQLFVDDPTDPDTRRLAAELEPEDSRLLGALLGASEQMSADTTEAASLVDWVQIAASSPAAGRTIGDLDLRSAVGATIVAVLRDRTYTDMDIDFRLAANDIVVVTGGQPALIDAARLLRGDTSAT